MNEVKKAIAHFKYGVDCDIFQEPVKTYAKNAISALEKQIPKKPIKKSEFSSYEYVSYRCPICNQHFLSKIEGEFVAGTKPKYCYKCGQALDWSDTE